MEQSGRAPRAFVLKQLWHVPRGTHVGTILARAKGIHFDPIMPPKEETQMSTWFARASVEVQACLISIDYVQFVVCAC